MMTIHPDGGGTRRRAAVAAANLIACAALGVGLVLAQASATPAPPASPAPPEKPAAPAPEKGTMDKPAAKKEVAVIKTNMGTIVFEFLPDVAPKMVDNFKDLAKTGFYDGTTFHRVINGFMIQGGDPLSKDNDPSNDGRGDGPRKMPAEFTTKYSHTRGMVSTARGPDVNSGSCQFFIVQKDSTFLDNKYTIFGRVLDGLDVVDKISNVPKDRGDRPLKNVVMEKVSVETR
ncbi:MAG TPA: peptidylprolyl isomerase [Candidatus Polarisedimenticolia bacterium]|jgi:cyclophilin family peptidyl-prolyl cis-trans isomerase|nr:peptidylprolyl isomerase [Candidatus Polarisedimenticolia bacterium]